MWILVQMSIDGRRKKFISSKNYGTIIKYINHFDNVKKYDDYHFISVGRDEEIEFIINLGESLDKWEV